MSRTGVAAFAAVLAWALVPVAYLLYRASGDDLVFGGATGPFPGDQYQYMSWIRSAGEHLLAGNGYDLTAGDRVFLHPMFALSGLAWRAGLSLQLALLLWAPVAALVLAGGFWAYVARLLDSPWARAGALVTALFFVTPWHPLIGWGELDVLDGMGLVAGELSPALASWGYLPAVIAMGLMPVFLLAAERVLEPARRAAGRGAGRYVAVAAAAGLLASWLHPWQGATLLLLLAAGVAWGRTWRASRPLWPAVVATFLPLLYYALLARWDPGWEIGRAQTDVDRPGLLVVAAAIAPLALLALAAGHRRVEGFQERVLRVWPFGAVAVYLLTGNQGYGLHSLEAMSLPLAILAVRGWRRLAPPRALAVAAIALVTLPGLLFTADFLRDVTDRDDRSLLLRPDEVEAMEHLDAVPGPGGVLASPRIAAAVPAWTGRRVWWGHPTWTPGFEERAGPVAALFAGDTAPPAARAFVRRTGVRWVLADCSAGRDLTATLRPLVASTRRFGCATVYGLRGTGPAARL